MYVREYMNTDVITVTKEASLGEAYKIMDQYKIRRLPVVDKHKLIGLITYDRIRETTKHPGIHMDSFEFLGVLSKLKVKDVMVTEVITVTPNTTVEEAVAIGQKHRIGVLPVVDNDRLVGICTTTDMYKLASQALGFGDPGVRIHVFGCRERPIAEVLNIIIAKKVPILSLVHVTPPGTGRKDCIIHLDTDDASSVVAELMMRGYGVEVRAPAAASYKEALVT